MGLVDTILICRLQKLKQLPLRTIPACPQSNAVLKQRKEVEVLSGEKVGAAKSAAFLGVLYGYSVHIFCTFFSSAFRTAPYMAELDQVLSSDWSLVWV